MGFCLGDRYTPNSNGTRNENPAAGPFTFNNCAPGNTQALSLTEGISPGYGDEYVPQLEGQYIDVTGVQPGQYWVVHRTNSDSALKESDYTNTGLGARPAVAERLRRAASPHRAEDLPGHGHLLARREGSHAQLLPLPARWHRRRRPAVPAAPLAAAGRPAADGQDRGPLLRAPALQRIVGQDASRASLRCSRSSRRGFRCVTTWKVAGSTYRGTLDIGLPPKNTEYWWTYRARLVRKNAHGVRTIARRTTRVMVPRHTK